MLAPVLRAGERFRGLRVHGELGRGAMGTAYLVSHEVLKTPLVLKVFAPAGGDPFREAHLAARVSSPHVVPVLDAGVEGGAPFVVQRYVDGVDLAELGARLRSMGAALPTHAVVRIVADVARGLSVIHRAGEVHRDIKPPHLFLSGSGEALLGDFGIALDPFDGGSQLPAAGTPAFVAPEIWRGELARPATDLYALGATAHLLAVGQPPFAGGASELAQAHLHQPYLPPPTRDPARAFLFTVIASLLEKDPSARPARADELSRMLARIEEPMPSAKVVSPTRAELGPLAIELVCGDLADEAADVIVNAAHGGLTMDIGVSAALSARAGASVEREAMASAPVGMGEVVWTSAGALRARFVAHAVAAMAGAVCIQRCVLRALLEARARDARSIAFPALGTGVGNVPHALAAKLMLEAIRTFAWIGPGSIERVAIVLFDPSSLAPWSSALAGT